MSAIVHPLAWAADEADRRLAAGDTFAAVAFARLALEELVGAIGAAAGHDLRPGIPSWVRMAILVERGAVTKEDRHGWCRAMSAASGVLHGGKPTPARLARIFATLYTLRRALSTHLAVVSRPGSFLGAIAGALTPAPGRATIDGA